LRTLRCCPPRATIESFDAYYKRFQTIFGTSFWIRDLFGETSSASWAFNHYRQWVLNLNVLEAYMLSTLVGTTTTFPSVFAAVCGGVSPAVRAGGATPAAVTHNHLTNINTGQQSVVPATPAFGDQLDAMQNRLQAKFSDQMSSMQDGLHSKLNALTIASSERVQHTGSNPTDPPCGRVRSRSSVKDRRFRESSRSPAQPAATGPRLQITSATTVVEPTTFRTSARPNAASAAQSRTAPTSAPSVRLADSMDRDRRGRPASGSHRTMLGRKE
jgi:hypothetical protein